MIYYVSRGTLNSAHSLTHSVTNFSCHLAPTHLLTYKIVFAAAAAVCAVPSNAVFM